MADIKQLAENLRRHNEWRRGADIEMDSPKKIGEWIDEAVRILDSLVEPEPIRCETCEDLAQQTTGPDSLDAQLIQVATGEISHIYIGGCPDFQTGYNSRDPDCPACIVLLRAEGKLFVPPKSAAETVIAPAIIESPKGGD